MNTVSNRLRPFCAAMVPNAAANTQVPGISGSVTRTPSARPARDQYARPVRCSGDVVMEVREA